MNRPQCLDVDALAAGMPGGTVVAECVSSVDVQPTILGLLGLEASGREQGRDASALLRGDSARWDNEAFIHHSSLERAGIFTPEWEFALVKGGDSILFDRKNDPDQVRNLHGDPRHRSAADELRQRVVSHHREVESPALKWLGPNTVQLAVPRTVLLRGVWSCFGHR